MTWNRPALTAALLAFIHGTQMLAHREPALAGWDSPPTAVSYRRVPTTAPSATRATGQIDPRCGPSRQQIDEYRRVLVGNGASVDSMDTDGIDAVVVQSSGTIVVTLGHPVARRAVAAAIEFVANYRPGETADQVESTVNRELFPHLRRIQEVPAGSMLTSAEMAVAGQALGYAATLRAYRAACGGRGAGGIASRNDARGRSVARNPIQPPRNGNSSRPPSRSPVGTTRAVVAPAPVADPDSLPSERSSAVDSRELQRAELLAKLQTVKTRISEQPASPSRATRAARAETLRVKAEGKARVADLWAEVARLKENVAAKVQDLAAALADETSNPEIRLKAALGVVTVAGVAAAATAASAPLLSAAALTVGTVTVANTIRSIHRDALQSIREGIQDLSR